MKYLFTLFIISLFGCSSQLASSAKLPIEFEDVNHYPFEIIAQKFQMIDTQKKMDAVFSVIHKKSIGNRLPPIPTVDAEETYVIFKPVLKNSNDVEIREIYTENDTLFIDVKEFENPQIERSSRVSLNILVKLLQKVSAKNLVINDPQK